MSGLCPAVLGSRHSSAFLTTTQSSTDFWRIAMERNVRVLCALHSPWQEVQTTAVVTLQTC